MIRKTSKAINFEGELKFGFNTYEFQKILYMGNAKKKWFCGMINKTSQHIKQIVKIIPLYLEEN